jgi:hypothetical membrane protein
MSMILPYVLVSTFVSVVSGAIGAVMSLTLYRSPRQRSTLTRPSTRILLGLLASLVIGIPLILLLWFMQWLGLSPSSVIPVALIATLVFVTLGTYGGYTVGIKIFEKRVDD